MLKKHGTVVLRYFGTLDSVYFIMHNFPCLTRWKLDLGCSRQWRMLVLVAALASGELRRRRSMYIQWMAERNDFHAGREEVPFSIPLYTSDTIHYVLVKPLRCWSISAVCLPWLPLPSKLQQFEGPTCRHYSPDIFSNMHKQHTYYLHKKAYIWGWIQTHYSIFVW